MDNIADQFLSELGNKLAYYRKKKNLSYRELAQLCSVDHSKISKIEKGQVNIQILTILELSKGLGIQPKKLLDFEVELEE
ncbi:helix-turn-helix transcriptional regulator [Niabella yanshanensis]|uniref:Helix-turn-helix transcriptional regulator n=1 Tax=Niabella yanshanensis TaxID=577386 RepID=A0ABZ0VZ55_9BACT|nr:helix-turn-helix transcriptional regulator [Niabella yanshanensis]WQD36305.1 helix-turn-helix transcriptional regulator [Niabella yanshanensis]